MRIWAAAGEKLGRLPARRVTWSLALLFASWIAADVLVFKLTAGLAGTTYDAVVRARVWSAAPDPRILLIDIDEASLARMAAEFGRWPWPRDTLATVLAHVEKQQPLAIAWDIVFSDADRLSPGGDTAFDTAARASRKSHFSVVRLRPANDAQSGIRQVDAPGLWTRTGAGSATVAAVLPALPGVAASRLGFNNGYPDADGVLRRYRYVERLPDGGILGSLPMSILAAVDPSSAQLLLARVGHPFYPGDGLIVWRGAAGAYPKVSFADVFEAAEGRAAGALPDFAGKVVIIGATAPSLHDIHPTPLSPVQPGLETLATAVDNALNRRQVAELPHAIQAVVAIAMCVGIAAWVQFNSVAALDPLLWLLPAALVGLSFLSLHGAPVFLDLHLAAAYALAFLALMRLWSRLRRSYWLSSPAPKQSPMAVWPWLRSTPWNDAALERLMDAVQRHAPDCRLIAIDLLARWPVQPLWPELARCVAIVGPADKLLDARASLEPALRALARKSLEPSVVTGRLDREQMAQLFYSMGARQLNPAITTRQEGLDGD